METDTNEESLAWDTLRTQQECKWVPEFTCESNKDFSVVRTESITWVVSISACLLVSPICQKLRTPVRWEIQQRNCLIFCFSTPMGKLKNNWRQKGSWKQFHAGFPHPVPGTTCFPKHYRKQLLSTKSGLAPELCQGLDHKPKTKSTKAKPFYLVCITGAKKQCHQKMAFKKIIEWSKVFLNQHN